MPSAPNVHIVIVGAGFGGLCTARRLQRILRDADGALVTLINRDNVLVMTPLLFEASSGGGCQD